MEQRSEDKTYFRTRSVAWDALGPNRAKLEAAAEAAALAAAANPAAAGGAPTVPQPEVVVRSSMFTPTPTRRMVRPPSHLVFRTKIVTRSPRPK
jgi:hypothetical protein